MQEIQKEVCLFKRMTETERVTNNHNSSGNSSSYGSYLSCPLCSRSYRSDIIEAHASLCTGEMEENIDNDNNNEKKKKKSSSDDDDEVTIVEKKIAKDDHGTNEDSNCKFDIKRGYIKQYLSSLQESHDKERIDSDELLSSSEAFLSKFAKTHTTPPIETDQKTDTLIPQLLDTFKSSFFSSSTTPPTQVILSSPSFSHFAYSVGDTGWGCGYRNIQMLHTSWQSIEPSLLPGPTPIPYIQQEIEQAWNIKQIDPLGKENYQGRLVGTTKWIGAGEAVTYFRGRGINCDLIDFVNGKRHKSLLEWVWNYYAEGIKEAETSDGWVKVDAKKGAMMLQHDGHSRSVVGIERTKRKGDWVYNLIMMDPMKDEDEMMKTLGKATNKAGGKNEMRIFRKSLNMMKKARYQLVVLNWKTPLFTDEDMEKLKGYITQGTAILENEEEKAKPKGKSGGRRKRKRDEEEEEQENEEEKVVEIVNDVEEDEEEKQEKEDKKDNNKRNTKKKRKKQTKLEEFFL